MKRFGARTLALLCAVALFVCYSSVLKGMWDQWSTDEDMSHGFFVPLAIAWVVWRERKAWGAIPPEPANGWGFAALAAGAAMQFISAIGGGLFAGAVALLVSAAGVVLCLAGWRRLRFWAFPFALALFMLPKLAIVYNQATLPLQLLASRMAAAILSIAGFTALREGNILHVSGHAVSVAEACNGIRYLLPLGFIALVWGYLSGSRTLVRIVLLVAAAPIAIAANAVRVALSASSPALAVGTAHMVIGWLIYVACLGALVGVRRLFRGLDVAQHA